MNTIKLNSFQVELLNAAIELNKQRARGELSNDEYIKALAAKKAEILARRRRERQAMRTLTRAYVSKLKGE